jgi:hypothetical protein
MLHIFHLEEAGDRPAHSTADPKKEKRMAGKVVRKFQRGPKEARTWRTNEKRGFVDFSIGRDKTIGRRPAASAMRGRPAGDGDAVSGWEGRPCEKIIVGVSFGGRPIREHLGGRRRLGGRLDQAGAVRTRREIVPGDDLSRQLSGSVAT